MTCWKTFSEVYCARGVDNHGRLGPGRSTSMSGVLRVHPVDRHVGQTVRKLRRRAGLSQPQLAQAMGVSFQQVQKYETGANRIGASGLFAIARRLSVPVSQLFDGLGPRALEDAPVDDGVRRGAVSSEQVLLSQFRRLPPSTRERLVRLLQFLADLHDPP